MHASGHRFLATVLKRLCRWYFCCDIPYQAEIDEDVSFLHNAFDVVINPNAKIQGGTVIHHSVTIERLDSTCQAPNIGRNVLIEARAVLLGNITIGDNAKIGAGAVVLDSVPDNCTAVGVPAKIIPHKQ